MTRALRRRGGAAALLLLAAAPPLAAQSAGYDPMAVQRGLDPLAAPPPPEAGDPELGNLPPGEGAEDVFYLCSACHSLETITQQRMTDARWDYTLTWMTEEQGMPELDPETRAVILAYLQAHFSSER